MVFRDLLYIVLNYLCVIGCHEGAEELAKESGAIRKNSKKMRFDSVNTSLHHECLCIIKVEFLPNIDLYILKSFASVVHMDKCCPNI